MAATLPKLPNVTPDYSGLNWSGATVINVAEGDSINTKLALAVSTLQALGPGGKVDVLLQQDKVFTEGVVLVPHGVKGGRIRIMTQGWDLAFPTRVTPSLAVSKHIATILAPDQFTNCIVAAQGARGYHIRGVKFMVPATEGFPAFINYTPLEGVNVVADLPWSHSVLQCWVKGNATGSTRRNGIIATAAMLQLGYNYCEHFNYGGEDYGHQGQSISIPNGIGRLNIHDNFLYRAAETIAVGGGNQFPAFVPERLVPSDITIKNNDTYCPLAVRGTELSANAFEMKQGRRVLVEGNWIRNVWKDGQSGYAFVFWSANQGGETFIHLCDVTIRYNVAIATNCGVSLGDHADVVLYGTSILPKRTNVHDNLFVAMGATETRAPGDSSTVAQMLSPEPGHGDIRFNNNTGHGPGGNFTILVEPATYDHFECQDNIIGGGSCTIIDSAAGKGNAAFNLMNADANCIFSGNVCITDDATSVPDGNAVAAVTDVFADTSKVNAVGFVYADLDVMVPKVAYAGKGANITALKAALPSSVVTADADLPT